MLLAFTLLAVVMTVVGGVSPLAGGWFSRGALSRLFSLRAGILLAVAFTEILPEAWAISHQTAGWAALFAFMVLFIGGHFAMLDSCPEYLEQCRVHYLGLAALSALFLHSWLDGLNLAVSFSAGAGAGAAVGLALALHKIADGFTLTSLFRQGGYGRRKTLAMLCALAAATPLGSLMGFWGPRGLPPAAIAGLLGFCAGSFVYVAANDVVPRLHKGAQRSEILYFSLGVLGMAALRFL